jgi:hypothetical protein
MIRAVAFSSPSRARDPERTPRAGNTGSKRFEQSALALYPCYRSVSASGSQRSLSKRLFDVLCTSSDCSGNCNEENGNAGTRANGLPELLGGQTCPFGQGMQFRPDDIGIDCGRSRKGGKPANSSRDHALSPTKEAKRTMRCTTSPGCSIKLVVESRMPGISTFSSGTVTSANTVHSCS